jgi:hypothetical protein
MFTKPSWCSRQRRKVRRGKSNTDNKSLCQVQDPNGRRERSQDVAHKEQDTADQRDDPEPEFLDGDAGDWASGTPNGGGNGSDE